jgi:hypothetical protein
MKISSVLPAFALACVGAASAWADPAASPALTQLSGAAGDPCATASGTFDNSAAGSSPCVPGAATTGTRSTRVAATGQPGSLAATPGAVVPAPVGKSKPWYEKSDIKEYGKGAGIGAGAMVIGGLIMGLNPLTILGLAAFGAVLGLGLTFMTKH